MVLRSEILVNKNVLPTKEQALPGRETPIKVPEKHFVNGNPLLGPFPGNVEFAIFGLGCFWGAERKFWQREGVFSTSVGYAGGFTPNPTYEEVCSGLTGHTEVVLVVYEPEKVSYEQLLKMFWELHNPTQGMRQGNDIGTQYRSVIYCTKPEQLEAAKNSAKVFQAELTKAGKGIITTEIDEAPTFYYAEAYHQQYLAKNPEGYCGIGGTGVTCPI
ncbi:peptide-methionine (S)-S-oxide reductase [Pseudomonas sp. PvR086]|jgi:peptide-methionine (S)-S-oxide reductase|uniref:Peptide-methionine (S)-S-oxide reductase n=2 Tax=Pseudomonas TaxID=286 RepID=A0ACC5MHJ3_9PSED|nr:MULTISPECIES: peptide-methionine (S)-S-oxide reductase MsrA [Pseudomonas]ANI58008.1 peptide methionine sulfoxide reductase [Pseudomonas sp. GR 6-02]ATE80033.1 peptide-methionine (S)-S-oxide reductase MsrA [Pseudomonas frederiksbergensis]MBB2888156.1 peptide-methionine (S)-S-oxide reductase [Pseudomonas umsongensis]MBD9604923.1 peptide-methionine (S)-S-oxide reductase MsrA [Pseudomonas sp. PDM08]MBD9617748.1 peptide-methionine (S)-S-oxide reductase MsrA [Pseudomonas sp. PDM07]